MNEERERERRQQGAAMIHETLWRAFQLLYPGAICEWVDDDTLAKLTEGIDSAVSDLQAAWAEDTDPREAAALREIKDAKAEWDVPHMSPGDLARAANRCADAEGKLTQVRNTVADEFTKRWLTAPHEVSVQWGRGRR